MKQESKTTLLLDGKRGLKTGTGEHVATVDAWACSDLRLEIVRRFNDYERLKKYAEDLERGTI